jgi:hypothetical protein
MVASWAECWSPALRLPPKTLAKVFGASGAVKEAALTTPPVETAGFPIAVATAVDWDTPGMVKTSELKLPEPGVQEKLASPKAFVVAVVEVTLPPPDAVTLTVWFE